MIFKWYDDEFVRAAGSVQRYIARYVNDPVLARELEADAYAIGYLPYDWSLNGTAPANAHAAAPPAKQRRLRGYLAFCCWASSWPGLWRHARQRLLPRRNSGRFLQTQAHQEAFHAVVFQGVIHWLAPRGPADAAPPSSMERYRGLMESALARGDLAESLLALQVLLEAMGDVVLEAIDTGSERRGLGFRRLRRVLRQQEQTHHAFGVHQLVNLVSADATQRARLQDRRKIIWRSLTPCSSSLKSCFSILTRIRPITAAPSSAVFLSGSHRHDIGLSSRA